MSRTLACIQLSRYTLLVLSITFIVLSTIQMLHIQLIPWPKYPQTISIILDVVLAFGILAGLTQHLKTLIFFSWIVALIFLLIFFGNTVSSQYQSDIIGMLFLFVMCVLGFTDAICIIRYRLPHEESIHHHHHGGLHQHQHMIAAYHHPGAIPHLVPPFKSIPPVYTGDMVDTMSGPALPPPPPPPPSSAAAAVALSNAIASAVTGNGHHPRLQQHHQLRQHQHPQHLPLHHSGSSGRGTSGGSTVQSPASPMPPLQMNSSHSCNYAPKNDPQFHAV